MVRRVKPTKKVKTKIPSICRPPPKPPDRQNRLNVKVSEKILSQMHAKEDRVNYMAPSKPPFIVNANKEGIRDLKREDLPYVVPKSKLPPKFYNIVRVSWTM